MITTLHTVLEKPSADERRVMEALLRRSSRIIVMAEKGRDILKRVHGANDRNIVMIPHGVPERQFVDPDSLKPAFGWEGREVVLTFGLLAPNKGIETMISALPQVVARHPQALYVVLGATHPNLVAHEGEAYRDRLHALAEEKGVAGHVHALPEGGGRHQDAAGPPRPRPFAEALDQAPLGPLALHQHLEFTQALEARLQLLADRAQRPQGRGQHHRAAADALRGLLRQARHGAAVPRIVRPRQLARHVQGRLRGIVERRFLFAPLIAAFVQINPVWAYGPYDPSPVTDEVSTTPVGTPQSSRTTIAASRSSPHATDMAAWKGRSRTFWLSPDEKANLTPAFASMPASW